MPSIDPIARFLKLQRRALAAHEPQRATAMTLATADASGRPSARMVLLKSADDRGFVFYTNYGSRKAQELDTNARAALVFYWASIDTQVRIEGTVARLEGAEADAYFASRPRQSQLGAWASDQSRPLRSRRELIGRYLEVKARYLRKPVPRPPHWGGYLLDPVRIEFWRSRLGRLHERMEYQRTADGGWTHGLRYP